MFTTRWRLFRLAGIPIAIDLSWLLILALLTFTFAESYPSLLRDVYHDRAVIQPNYIYWIMGLVSALAFFGCILLHELGHAIVGRSLGMPINGITLFLFGGVAELGEEPKSASSEFLMAIAGPIVSVVLAITCGILAWIGYTVGWPQDVVIILAYLALINTTVLVFNLIPAFPLDGGRVLRSILWGVTGRLRRATHWASVLGQVFAWLFIAYGVLLFFSGPALWVSGVWMFLIGLFLNNAAKSSYQQVLIRSALQGEPVRRFMNPHPITVPPSLSLQEWVDDYVYRYHRKGFPVTWDNRLLGFISTDVLQQFPRPEWDLHTVSDVMRRDIDALRVSPEADATEALAKMQRTGSSRLLVMDDDHLAGIISLKDLLRFLNLKMELEGPDGNEESPSSRLPEPHHEEEIHAHS